MSGAAAAAAFITLAVVFMVGLFTMCLLKKMSGQPTALAAKPTMLKHKLSEMAKNGSYKDMINKELNAIPAGDMKAFVMYLPTCGHCHNLINKVIKPLEKDQKLPMPITLLELNKNVAEATKESAPLKAMMSEASGVPTTIVVQKLKDGSMNYAPIVGGMDSKAFMDALKDAAGKMKPLPKA